MPRRRSSSKMPHVMVVLPDPLCVAAMRIRGAVMVFLSSAFHLKPMMFWATYFMSMFLIRAAARML